MNREANFIQRNKGILLYLLIALVFLSLLRYFFFETYLVSQTSMEKTLLDGDKVLVYKKAAIERNKVFVFENESGTYIKRCIGLPGDTLVIINGVVFINGKPLAFPGTILASGNKRNLSREPDLDIQVLHYYSRSWTKLNFGPLIIPGKAMIVPTDGEGAKVYEQIIKQEQPVDSSGIPIPSAGENKYYSFRNDYYFFLGDNRPVSEDSRVFGPISRDKIIGRACGIIYSRSNWKRVFKHIE
jgi:signal peptidase I